MTQTQDRLDAWRETIAQIERLGSAKFRANEEAVLRNAASDLMLLEDTEGDECRAIKQAVTDQLDELVASGRLIKESRDAILTPMLAIAYRAPALAN